MSELLNQKSSVQGKVPSGYFNALFDLMGAWLTDAKEIKYLAFDGYFISLFNLNLKASPLVLCDEVKKAVPSKWDPVALSWFIRTYGTHIIVEMAVGGQDVICVKQSHSSTISSAELKLHLEDLGDFLFSDGKNLSPIHRKTKDGKSKVPDVFVRIVQQPNNLHLSSYSESSTKDFQVPLQWAPVFNVLVLGPQKRKGSYPSLQFRFLGPKLRVNTSQVSSAQKPVVGLRLYLEGRKCNQLAIHVQHLSSVPSMLGDSMASSMSEWRESEDTDPGYIEAIQWNSYSCISTSVVKYNPEWSKRVSGGVFIVTGAQLFTKGTWARKVLHLRLLYTHIPKCTIHKSEWTRAPAASQKGSFFTTISTTLSSPFMHRNAQPAQKHEPAQLNSGVYPDGPPVPLQSRKLLKFVDMSEVVKGAHDVPGHWLVTAAKLVKEAGKIGLHVKFALLNYDDTEQPHGSIMSYHCK
ncbi:unnamed protein product [Triticum turgidum subsp. durum]|nr:unnamed protein product [Triticum turgidum subsp. durum]